MWLQQDHGCRAVTQRRDSAQEVPRGARGSHATSTSPLLRGHPRGGLDLVSISNATTGVMCTGKQEIENWHVNKTRGQTHLGSARQAAILPSLPSVGARCSRAKPVTSTPRYLLTQCCSTSSPMLPSEPLQNRPLNEGETETRGDVMPLHPKSDSLTRRGQESTPCSYVPEGGGWPPSLWTSRELLGAPARGCKYWWRVPTRRALLLGCLESPRGPSAV